MRRRGGVVIFLSVLLLGVVLVLHIFSMIKSDRFYNQLNRLEDILSEGGLMYGSDAEPCIDVLDGKYAGDEGDWLVWAFRVEPRTLNQISVEGDIYSRWITTPNILEPLLVYDFNEVKLKFCLAESYEISNDGLEISFKLKNNVYFSDGEPVTADDVIFTYETIINPKVDAANLASLYIDVDMAVKVSEREVKFVMKRPYFKALENLSFFSIGILPKHIYEFEDPQQFNKRTSNPVGSGPYVFERWDVGQQIVLRRNENYWGQKPKLKKIVYRFITNPAAGVQALKSGEVDIVIPEPEQFADLVEKSQPDEDFKCVHYWNPGAIFYFIGWNMDSPIFADRQIRLAMTHIIDRDRIVSELLKGYGEKITGPFFVKGNQNDPNIKAWPCDLKRAAKLLDEAGWVDSDEDGIRDKDGVSLTFEFMYSSSYALYERIAKMLKDDAEKVGIEVIANPMEWSVVISKAMDRDFDALMMGGGGDILEDQFELWHSSQVGNRGYNFVGFSNKEADEILETAHRTLDEKTRNKLYRKLHGILHAQQPFTFLFARPTYRLVDKRFRNTKVHKLGYNYLEWYVPKAEQRYR